MEPNFVAFVSGCFCSDLIIFEIHPNCVSVSNLCLFSLNSGSRVGGVTLGSGRRAAPRLGGYEYGCRGRGHCSRWALYSCVCSWAQDCRSWNRLTETEPFSQMGVSLSAASSATVSRRPTCSLTHHVPSYSSLPRSSAGFPG